MIVIDSSVLIDHLRGDARAQEVMRTARGAGRPMGGSTVTRVELLTGMRADEKRPTAGLLRLLDWHPVDERVADLAGSFGRRYRESHQGLGAIDLLIAATAALLDAELWTRNVKHFPMFAGLQAPY